MTNSETNLVDLTDDELEDRLGLAYRRFYEIKEEVARRKNVARYGNEVSELHEFSVDFEAHFSLTVKATDEEDATAVMDEADWIIWDVAAPGGAVTVEDYDNNTSRPEKRYTEQEYLEQRAQVDRKLAIMGLPPLTPLN